MRGRRAFAILTIYLILMSGLVLMVYVAFASASGNPFGPSSRQAGKAIFAAVLGVQIFLVIFVGPSFTSAAISGEKERKTYDLLRTTLLSARSLVTGKLLSALGYVFLLIVASIPLQSVAFLLGGISLLELFLSEALVVVSAVTYAMIGLYLSSVMRTTLAASVSTFAAALLLTVGIPTLALTFVAFLGPFFFGSASPAFPVMALMIYGGLLLAAVNLPATLVVSELFLLEQDALFFFSEVIDGRTLYLFSPWFIYAILHVFFALFLYWISVRRVRRIAVK